MADKPEPRKRTGQTSRIQKPPTSSQPAAAPSGGTSRRLGGAGAAPRRGSAGERLVKTRTGPSTIGRIIKITLVLIVVLGIPGIITASFFVKAGKKKTVAMAVLDMIKKKLGMEVAPDDPEIKKADASAKHPKVAEFDRIVVVLHTQQKLFDGIRKDMGKHDDKTPWPKEEAVLFHDRLDQVDKQLGDAMLKLEELNTWLREFNTKKGEAEDLYEKFRADENKKMAADTGAGGKVPEKYQEAAKDPDVAKYIEICLALEIGKYKESLIPDEVFSDEAQKAQRLRIDLRGLRAKLPDKRSLSGEAPPEPPKAAPAAFNAKSLHPWSGAKPGTWVRTRMTLQGKATFEDRIVKEATEDAVVFTVIKSDGEKVSDPSEATEKFVDGEVKVHPDEAVKVGEQEMICRVVETGNTRSWVVKKGPGAGRVWLKRVVGNREDVATAVGLEPVAIKGEDKECIWVETKSGKMWFLDGFPSFLVKYQNPQILVEVVDWGTDAAARPELPMAAKPPEPAPIALPKRPEPFGSFKTGAWRREKTTMKRGEQTMETYTDLAVEEVSDAAARVKIDMVAPDGRSDSRQMALPFEGAAPSKVLREEKLKVGEAEVACLVIESKSGPGVRLEWLPKEGLGANLVPLKVEASPVSSVVSEIAEGTAKVGGREVKVLKVKGEDKVEGAGAVKVETWYSIEVPGFLVRRAADDGTLTELLDFGDDVSKKPALALKKPEETPKPAPTPAPEPVKPPEPPKPVEKTAADILKDADAAIVEGVSHYRTVSASMEKLPDDQDKLKQLLEKKQQAAAALVRAKETYLSLGDKIPASANAPKKIAQIEVLLTNLQKFEEGIKSKLK